MPKVSIIIPAYNAEKTLESCVCSVLAQEYPVDEIVIVNDGSVDRTKEICQKLSTYEKVLVVHQKNEGVSAARNRGLDLISGDYVIFVDSDDMVEPYYVSALLSGADFDFVTAGFSVENKENIWHIQEYSDESTVIEHLKKYPSRYMGKYYFGAPWGKLFKRELIEKYGIRFNTQIHSGEDTLFIFEYLYHVKNIRIMPYCGYKYSYSDSSLAHKFHENYWKWKIIVETEIRKFFEPQSEFEIEYLLLRDYEVLRNLLIGYSQQMTIDSLLKIYQHQFFKSTIQYKRKNGTFMERVLLFSMEKKNYQLYVKVDRLYSLFSQVHNKIQYILKRN